MPLGGGDVLLGEINEPRHHGGCHARLLRPGAACAAATVSPAGGGGAGGLVGLRLAGSRGLSLLRSRAWLAFI